MSWVLALTVGVLTGAGLYQILQRDLIKVVLGFSLLLGAVNLFILVSGTFVGADAPYVRAEDPTDPVPQALILTAIAIGFGVTALLSSLVLALSRTRHTLDGDDVTELRG